MTDTGLDGFVAAWHRIRQCARGHARPRDLALVDEWIAALAGRVPATHTQVLVAHAESPNADIAADRLACSRATYFRRLRRAREAVAQVETLATAPRGTLAE